VCVVFYSAYTFPNRKVKSGVGELREGSLELSPVECTSTYTSRVNILRGNLIQYYLVIILLLLYHLTGAVPREPGLFIKYGIIPCSTPPLLPLFSPSHPSPLPPPLP